MVKYKNEALCPLPSATYQPRQILHPLEQQQPALKLTSHHVKKIKYIFRWFMKGFCVTNGKLSVKGKQIDLIIHVLFHFLYKFHLPSLQEWYHSLNNKKNVNNETNYHSASDVRGYLIKSFYIKNYEKDSFPFTQRKGKKLFLHNDIAFFDQF